MDQIENAPVKKFVGWFSQKQADVAGTGVWLSASGSEVLVTEVTREDVLSSNWPDSVCVGEVTKCLRVASTGTLSAPHYFQFQTL